MRNLAITHSCLSAYEIWPIQNNGIEGTNAHVKGPDGTFRERLGVLQFLKELEDGFIKRWSTERSPVVVYPDGREEPNVNQMQLSFREP